MNGAGARPRGNPTLLHTATLALALLAALCFVWELWWAPLRPGGSLLALKGLPLLLPLPRLLAVRRDAARARYTLQWSSMLALGYFAEGIVRGMTDRAPSATLGWLETALAVLYVGCATGYLAPFKRAARKP